MKNILISILLLLLFVMSIVCKEAVITGAAEGLLLWYQTLLPTLLPVMILTKVIMQTDSLFLISNLLSPIFHFFPGVSTYAGFAVVAGFFCGYPTGAKIIADLINSNKITEKEGSYLLSFCNNISPMFISGYLLTNYISEKSLHLPLFLILLTTPLLCSQLFRINQRNYTSRSILDTTVNTKIRLTLDECMMDSFESIVMVGLYVMIFSIFIKYLSLIPLPDSPQKTFIFSLLEITNGLKAARTAHLPKIISYSYYVFLTSFGGICAIFQTASMIRNTNLSILSYIIKKLIIAIITSFVCYVYLLMN